MTRIVAFLLSFLLLAAPAAAEAPFRLQPLEQRLQAIANINPGNIGIAALDLTSGEMVSVHGDEPFPMASTVKVAIAAAYLTQVEHGRRSLDDRIEGRSVRSLMEAMLIRSDNAATDIILRNLGGPKAMQEWLTFHRLEGLRVDRSIARLLADRRDLRDVRDSSTPKAMVNLLARLDQGILQPQSRTYLLDLMARCATGKNRMRGLLPSGTPVAHKTGTLNGLTTDVGFITLPDGRRVAVALFARSGVNRPMTLAQAARSIYDGFSRISLPLSGPFVFGGQ
ncbi:serine hydrolase [Sphingomonas rhizophila]|uniref:Beta-lactamase n=1 Tax=Sphingomonas rhizophila TaxID=2071607 RepID=A0A7G9S8A7_9SPHN|nr:serine hydrolase [Sphingomonas rhizophila]QNN64082.1 serine hydrolase [Sphingomonas rhizophila]